MKWTATEMKPKNALHKVDHTWAALVATASYAWRKRLKRNLLTISFPRTALLGTFSWICFQLLVTQVNLDSYLQLFIAAKKKLGDMLRKYLLLLHWPGNKPVIADQLPFTDTHRNGFSFGDRTVPEHSESRGPTEVPKCFQNSQLRYLRCMANFMVPGIKQFPKNITHWTIWFLYPWTLQLFHVSR